MRGGNSSLGFVGLIGACLMALQYLNASAARSFGVIYAIEQRQLPYIRFYEEVMSANFFDIIFGFQVGFGGYSNILIDVFARTGVIGVVATILMIVLPGVNLGRRLYCSTDVFGKVALLCLLTNLTIGNLSNLNLTQPFYVINLIMLLCATLYFFGSSKNANTDL